MREVLKALRPVKRRIRRNRVLRGAAAGLAAGLLSAALLQIAALFLPVADRELWAAAIVGTVLSVTVFANILRPVKNTEAAKTADRCGLEERAITALENHKDRIGQLQRTDTCKALHTLDTKQIRPGSVKKLLIAALGCGLLLGILLFIPSPQDSTAAAGKALARMLQEGREAIQKAAEKDEAALTEEKRNELRRITDELNRELGSSRDAADAMVALDRAEQQLKQMRQQTAGEAMNKADAAAGEGPDGQKDGQKGQTAEQSFPENETGSKEGWKTNTIAETVLTDAQMQTLQAMAALKNAVNPSSGQQAAAVAPAGIHGKLNGEGTDGNIAVGTLSTGKQSEGGAGEGSTNEEQAGSGQHSNMLTKGNRDPRYKEMEYETLYDPEHIDKAKQNVLTEQNRLELGDPVQIEAGPGQGSTEGDVPWNEVLEDYAGTEARSADRENLTVQERQWVNAYFALLTEQQ